MEQPLSEDGFLRTLHAQLENPQYPFALRWRQDGCFVFQAPPALEAIALEPFDMPDKTAFFNKLAGYAFERLMPAMSSSSNQSIQHVFSHPHFVPHDVTRLQYIQLRGFPRGTWTPELEPPAFPPPLIPLPLAWSSPPFEPASSMERTFSNATSSPMIRSPGLSSSTFSASSLSWGPLTPPTMIHSPRVGLDSSWTILPTALEPSRSSTGPRKQEDNGIRRVQMNNNTSEPNVHVPSTEPDHTKHAIAGLAGLSFGESGQHASSSPVRRSPHSQPPVFVHPAHHFSPRHNYTYSPAQLSSTQQLQSGSLGGKIATSESLYTSATSSNTAATLQTPFRIPSTPLVSRKKRKSHLFSGEDVQHSSSQPSAQVLRSDPSPSLSLLAAAAATGLSDLRSLSSSRGRGGTGASRKPYAYQPYRVPASDPPSESRRSDREASKNYTTSSPFSATGLEILPPLPSSQPRSTVATTSCPATPTKSRPTQALTYWSPDDHRFAPGFTSDPDETRTTRPTSSIRDVEMVPNSTASVLETSDDTAMTL